MYHFINFISILLIVILEVVSLRSLCMLDWCGLILSYWIFMIIPIKTCHLWIYRFVLSSNYQFCLYFLLPSLLSKYLLDFQIYIFNQFGTFYLVHNPVYFKSFSVIWSRVHGVTVAEMPLIATCGNYRCQGMCRRLMTVIKEVLSLGSMLRCALCSSSSIIMGKLFLIGF